jgi:hypothetical protein
MTFQFDLGRSYTTISEDPVYPISQPDEEGFFRARVFNWVRPPGEYRLTDHVFRFHILHLKNDIPDDQITNRMIDAWHDMRLRKD